ncbi:MAG: preprotein translocase subunit SecE [Caldilineaceae bacterium]
MSRSAIAKSDNALVKYFRDTRAELGKVTWPTREEGIRLTGIVVAATIVSGIALFGIDYLFGSLIGVLISAL